MKKRNILLYTVACVSVVVILTYLFSTVRLNKNVFKEIQQGNFSEIKGLNRDEINELRTVYKNQCELGETEWIINDINDDSYNELIWREKDYYSKNMRSIIAIFTETESGFRRVYWDIFDTTEFIAYENNNLIYYKQYFGLFDDASYFKCIINENYEIEREKEMQLLIMPSDEELIEQTDEDFVLNMKKQYSFLNGEGNYFIIRTYKKGVQEEKVLTEKEWMAEFVSLTGYSLEQGNTYLYELID